MNEQYVEQHNILVSGPTNNGGMNNFKITNLREPTHSKDATTKNYVTASFSQHKENWLITDHSFFLLNSISKTSATPFRPMVLNQAWTCVAQNLKKENSVCKNTKLLVGQHLLAFLESAFSPPSQFRTCLITPQNSMCTGILSGKCLFLTTLA